jgi:hypothetical protein
LDVLWDCHGGSTGHEENKERREKGLQGTAVFFVCLFVCFVQTNEDPDLIFKPGKV